MIKIIMQKLKQFKPYHLKIIDKSSMHIDHKHNFQKYERNLITHLLIEIGSHQWQNISLISRHRAIKNALKSQFANGLHSISIKIITHDS